MKVWRSIQWRMYLAALVGCLLVGAFVVMLSLSYLRKEQRADSEKYYIEKADGIAEQVEIVLSDLNAVAVQLQSSAELQRMFVTAGSSQYTGKNYFVYNLEDRKEAQGVIWMFVAARPQIVGIHIFSDSSYVGMREMPTAERIQELSSQAQFDFPEGTIKKLLGLHRDQWDVLQQRDVISVVRVFEATDYNFSPVGTIEVQAKYSLIKEICEDNKTASEQVVIAAADGTVIYPAEGITAQQAKQLLALTTDETVALHTTEFDDVDSIIATRTIMDSDWTVFVLDDARMLNQSIQSVIPATFLAAIPIFLLILACVAVTVRHVMKPILHLTNEVEQITPDNLHAEFVPTQLRELDTLQQAFTRLLDCTDEANQKVLLSQQTELKLRIEALQAQVNPHYLFNSLSAISAVGTEENSDRIPMMCYQLGELFRYVSLEETAQTTLADEMEHISRYIDFMKWRYEENLHSEIHIEGDLSQIPIARLSLQPLVENCFTHGFAGAFPPYRIRIDCSSSEKGWHFIIADSGCGFSKEKIYQISQDIYMVDDVLRTHRGYEKLKSQNMAILNLYIRLKLQYGEKLWFEIIRDEELGGALVKIVTEYDRKE